MKEFSLASPVTMSCTEQNCWYKTSTVHLKKNHKLDKDPFGGSLK